MRETTLWKNFRFFWKNINWLGCQWWELLDWTNMTNFATYHSGSNCTYTVSNYNGCASTTNYQTNWSSNW